MIRENLNPNVGIQGILPTMFDGRTLHSREAIEILQENFGELVFKTRIKKTVRYAEAPVQGSSVLKYDPSGNAADGLPGAGEGGARWRESAQACVRGRSPSCSGRPRRRSARRRRRARSVPGEPLEETVEHPPPTPRLEVAPEPEPRSRHAEPEPQTPDHVAPNRRCSPSDRGIARLLEPMPEPPPRLHRAPQSDAAYLAVIRVVGVGGAGLNAVNRMIDAGHLGRRVRRGQHRPPAARAERRAELKIHIGRELTGGPRLRRRARHRPTRGRGGVRPDQASARAAPTWSSSPRARAAEPAPVRLRSSPGSPARSAR